MKQQNASSEREERPILQRKRNGIILPEALGFAMVAGMSEKLLLSVDESWQVDAIKAQLAPLEIEVQVTFKAREYASVITGIGGNSYHLYVAEEKWAQAQAAIRTIAAPLQMVDEGTHVPTRNYFRRVVIFSVLSIVTLPFIFNWVAQQNYFLLKAETKPSGPKSIAAIVLYGCWFIAAMEIIGLIRWF